MLFSLWLGVRLVGNRAGWAGIRQPESTRKATQVPYPGTAAWWSCSTHAGQSNVSIPGALRRRPGHLRGATPRPGMVGPQCIQHPAELVEHRAGCREDSHPAGQKPSRRNVLQSHCLGVQHLPSEPGDDLAPGHRCTDSSASTKLV